MIAVIQRVKSAQVSIDQTITGQIKKGFVVLLGVVKNDQKKDLDYLVDKISKLRIMSDDNQKMNLNLKDVNGQILVISQFTLCADTKKGNRPSFIKAADSKTGEKYYHQFIKALISKGFNVATGQFGAYMDVSLINSGPVTIILDSKSRLTLSTP